MNRVAGYTLLEMVVVLAVVALATGMAAPSMSRMIQTWREASDVKHVIAQFSALSWRVQQSGESAEFRPETLPSRSSAIANDGKTPAIKPLPIDLPEQWKVTFDTPLTIQANGACSDSTAILRTTHQNIRLRIAAPFCKTSQISADTP